MTATDEKVEALLDVDLDRPIPCFCSTVGACDAPAVWQSIVMPCGHRRCYCDSHKRLADWMEQRDLAENPQAKFCCHACREYATECLWRRL